MIELTEEKLDWALCQALEPTVPVITARDARAATKGFRWCSCHYLNSPKGWWVAEIGTDHQWTDDDLVAWKPRSVTEDIASCFEVIDEMRAKGWLFHILQMSDGWVVNASREMASYFVQEIGDSAEEAICRAALAAIRTGTTK